jgi:hypothetical protein
MKRIFAVLAIIALLGVFIIPTVFNSNYAYAQSNNPITNVGHTVEILYSGHILITDVIRYAGISISENTMPNELTMALPAKYAPYLLEVKAFNNNITIPITSGVTIEGHPELYGFHVDLAGAQGDSFQVSFILSNNLITQNGESYTLDYPAYPVFLEQVSFVSSEIKFPSGSSPLNFTIAKSDGNLKTTTYTKTSQPAYTSVPALATFFISKGTLQLTQIPTLTREVHVSPSGSISETDTYRIINNSTGTISSFQLGAPLFAEGITVTDEFGQDLVINGGPIVSGSNTRLNVTLASPLFKGQIITLIAHYTEESAAESGSSYLANIEQFPYIDYYVDSGTMKLYLPEGATIVAPNAATLNQIGTVTNQGFQKILTINRQGITFQDYSIPGLGYIPIIYDYNPVWSALTATFIAFGISVVAVIIVLVLRKRQTAEKPLPKPSLSTKTEEHATTGKGTYDKIEDLNEAYEERINVVEEMDALDARVQKNKIPRRQYKTQHQALQHRYESLNKKISHLKDSLRSLGPDFADLMKQLDQADDNLTSSEEDLKTLEDQKGRGEISNEEYHESLNNYQRKKDKAQGSINGILLRIREKIH